VNHFIPYSEEEIGAPDRFKSDFMVQYLKKKKLSKEAQAVLNEGRLLWKAYFSATDNYRVREELKLNRADVGWYQIRNALKKRNESDNYPPIDFSKFEGIYFAGLAEMILIISSPSSEKNKLATTQMSPFCVEPMVIHLSSK